MKLKTLPLKNLRKKPFRTGALVLIAALMTIALFGGSVAAASMKNGLDSLEQRLGADIIVVPEDAEAKVELENILLQGTPGYFYMDKSIEEQIASIEGVELTSPQYFLVSANAECCSVQVQIIGFDEDSDFSIKPWLKQCYDGKLGENEIIVGSSLSTKVGHTLKLYGVDCKAVGKLDATGTGLDTAIYTTPETVRTLIKASMEKGIGVLSKQSPDDVISSVYIKVKDGYDISQVVGEINLRVDGVEAVRTRSMITGTADRLSAISGSIGIIKTAVWILAAVILTAAFSVLAGVRRREFAIMRTIGFSRKQLGAEVFSESTIICAGGIIAGILLTAVTVFQFGSLIEQRTGLPYLSPDIFSNIRYAVITAVAVLLTGVISSAYSAYRLSRADTGNILREGD
ncbi:ABC transporter permease [Ruminococcus albus]|uniref:Putative hemin transport system permease protein HrtB n=1 Tax=Ruminococcus albus TaxID=1264 RepID=A0A1H7IX08_RUMAL|nr:FtsX-like permease family protein [Ruminococcus albus]SEK67051.1 putative ABC transport system permease protein [Ruminococcus albus]